MINLGQLRPVLRLVCIYSWEFLHTEDWDGLLRMRLERGRLLLLAKTVPDYHSQTLQGIALHEVILLILGRDGTSDFQLIHEQT